MDFPKIFSIFCKPSPVKAFAFHTQFFQTLPFGLGNKSGSEQSGKDRKNYEGYESVIGKGVLKWREDEANKEV